jgi:hypothetical protein
LFFLATEVHPTTKQNLWGAYPHTSMICKDLESVKLGRKGESSKEEKREGV